MVDVSVHAVRRRRRPLSVLPSRCLFRYQSSRRRSLSVRPVRPSCPVVVPPSASSKQESINKERTSTNIK